MTKMAIEYTPERWDDLIRRYYFEDPEPLSTTEAARARELLTAWRPLQLEYERRRREGDQ